MQSGRAFWVKIKEHAIRSFGHSDNVVQQRSFDQIVDVSGAAAHRRLSCQPFLCRKSGCSSALLTKLSTFLCRLFVVEIVDRVAGTTDFERQREAIELGAQSSTNRGSDYLYPVQRVEVVKVTPRRCAPYRTS